MIARARRLGNFWLYAVRNEQQRMFFYAYEPFIESYLFLGYLIVINSHPF